MAMSSVNTIMARMGLETNALSTVITSTSPTTPGGWAYQLNKRSSLAFRATIKLMLSFPMMPVPVICMLIILKLMVKYIKRKGTLSSMIAAGATRLLMVKT